MPDSQLPIDQFQERYVAPAQGRTLIVGSKVFSGREDRRTRYKDVIGVDMQEGEGVDRVLNLEEIPPDDMGRFAHIECMSVLEHSRKPWLMAKNIERLLEPGGTLFLSAPFIWRPHQYPGDFWRFTKDGVKALFTAIEWDAVLYGHEKLTGKDRIPNMKRSFGAIPYLARTEVLAFGRMVCK